MKNLIWTGVFSAAMLLASTASAEPIIAKCDCKKTDTGEKGSASWEIDSEKRTVDGKPADFGAELIQWTDIISDDATCKYKRFFAVNRYKKTMVITHYNGPCAGMAGYSRTDQCECELKKIEGRAL